MANRTRFAGANRNARRRWLKGHHAPSEDTYEAQRARAALKKCVEKAQRLQNGNASQAADGEDPIPRNDDIQEDTAVADAPGDDLQGQPKASPSSAPSHPVVCSRRVDRSYTAWMNIMPTLVKELILLKNGAASAFQLCRRGCDMRSSTVLIVATEGR